MTALSMMEPADAAEAGRPRLHPVAATTMLLSAAGLAALVLPGLGHRQVVVAAAYGLLVFVGELARVTLPGDREVAPVAVAAAVGYALAFNLAGHGLAPHVAATLTVVIGASAAGALLHGLAGRPVRLGTLPRRLGCVALCAALFPPAYRQLDVHTVRPLRLVLALMGFALLAGVVDTLLGAAERSVRQRTPFLPGVRDEAIAMGAIGGAIGSTAVLLALTTSLMGLWALPVLAGTLLVAQFSLRRYSGIRTTYRQTIRALSKVTEVGGYVRPGHSARVAALAVATGREVGMTEAELLDLEYAALMHDIGQLSLNEPIPGGSTLTVPPVQRRRIAELGAEVIRSSAALDRVAVIVERQADPYRRNRQPPDPSLPLASRIIKAASAYDDVAAPVPGDDVVRADALERLRLGMAYEYDPRVVEALARVVARTRRTASAR